MRLHFSVRWSSKVVLEIHDTQALAILYPYSPPNTVHVEIVNMSCTRDYRSGQAMAVTMRCRRYSERSFVMSGFFSQSLLG